MTAHLGTEDANAIAYAFAGVWVIVATICVTVLVAKGKVRFPWWQGDDDGR